MEQFGEYPSCRFLSPRLNVLDFQCILVPLIFGSAVKHGVLVTSREVLGSRWALASAKKRKNKRANFDFCFSFSYFLLLHAHLHAEP